MISFEERSQVINEGMTGDICVDVQGQTQRPLTFQVYLEPLLPILRGIYVLSNYSLIKVL